MLYKLFLCAVPFPDHTPLAPSFVIPPAGTEPSPSGLIDPLSLMLDFVCRWRSHLELSPAIDGRDGVAGGELSAEALRVCAFTDNELKDI